MSLQAAVDALVLVRDELERVDVSQQRRVGVDDFFHVGGRDLRAVERDGQVAAPEDVKNGEATLPRGETLNVQALRGERGRELLVRQHAAEVAKVVAKLGRRSEEHTSELQSRQYLVCRLLLEKKTDP